MTGLSLPALTAFADPRVGIPCLLLIGLLAAWFLLWPSREPRVASAETPMPAPDSESVSRTYLGLAREEYSVALREMYRRVDRRVLRRTGRSFHQLPWRSSSQRRMGIPDPAGLRRSLSALDRLERWAYRLETGSFFRWDLWRSAESSQRALKARLAPGLLRASRVLTGFDQIP